MVESRENYIRKKLKKPRKSLVDKYMHNDFLNDFSMDSELPLLLNNPERPHFGAETRVMQAFSIRLCLENIPRLTEYYNSRCLPVLKTHFPRFFEDLRRTGSSFAQEVTLPCEMKSCNEEQFDQQIEAIRQHQRNHRRGSESSVYKAFRDAMREEAVAFKPITSKLIVLLSRWWQTPVHNSLMSYVEVARGTHAHALKYTLVNNFLRSVKDDDYESNILRLSPTISTIRCMTDIFPGILLPFTTDSELVVYRADNMKLSTDFFVVKGILSTSLAFNLTRSYGDERKLKIVMPPGTPFLPMIIFHDELAEIALLPGTELELLEEKTFEEGIFAEYRVTKNPPAFTDVEVATILRAFISSRLTISGDVPSEEDNLKYFRTLVNKKYSGDW